MDDTPPIGGDDEAEGETEGESSTEQAARRSNGLAEQRGLVQIATAPTMLVITAASKSRAHVECNKVLNSVVAEVKLASTDVAKDMRRFLDKMEEAAWYQDANSPNYVNDHQFWTRLGADFLTEVGRTQHRQTMQTPAVKVLWDTARAQELLYMNRLRRDSQSTDPEVTLEAFGAIWPVYRNRFLGVELQPWHIAHSKHFSNPAWAQGDRTVQTYFVDVFASLSRERDKADGWDRPRSGNQRSSCTPHTRSSPI